MDQQRFEALAEAYGGDLARWPQEERAAASTYLAAQPDLAEPVLMAAQALDAVLADAAIEAPSDALYENILASGIGARPARRPVWAAAAAAIMLTVGMGTGWLATPAPADPTEDIFAVAFGAFETADTLSLEEEA